MAVVVQDEFTEVSNTALTAHTPTTTGTGWTERDRTGLISHQVFGAFDDVAPSSSETDDRVVTTSDPDPTEADVDVEATCSSTLGSGSGDAMGFVARYADNSNFYSAGTYQASAGSDKKIFKEVSAVVTELATGDNGLSVGDTFKFELRGTTLKLFHKGVEELSATDSAITAAGSAGIFHGSVWVAGDDKSNLQAWDDYKCTEFAGVAIAGPITQFDSKWHSHYIIG